MTRLDDKWKKNIRPPLGQNLSARLGLQRGPTGHQTKNNGYVILTIIRSELANM